MSDLFFFLEVNHKFSRLNNFVCPDDIFRYNLLNKRQIEKKNKLRTAFLAVKASIFIDFW